MLWERKMQLQREMAEMLDPSVGQDVVGAMRKEIHRMTLRHRELLRLQEGLIKELETSISKRGIIQMKARIMKVYV